MADKKRVLLVAQELKPYTEISEMSDVVFQTAQMLQENGADVRILMPRFGVINERRHRLHEVVRLSGVNITVDDDDYPLIIKVASLPGTRLQVYFLDNEEFFKRKEVFEDSDGALFDDNIDRMLFFCKSAMETVKKFGWSPDIVHCHGWMTSLLPAYLKTSYRHEPVFQNAKVVYSVYSSEHISKSFAELFREKATLNQLQDALDAYETTNGLDLECGAAKYADGVIENIEYEPLKAAATSILAKNDALVDNYFSFYRSLSVAEAVK